MPRVIIITRGTAGDVMPFLEMGSALVRRGNDVLLITHCHYEQVARRAGLGLEPLDTPEQFHAFVNDGPFLEGPSGVLEFSQRHVFPRTPAELDILKRCCQGPGVVVIARHMSSIAAPLFCEFAKAPLVSVFVVAAQASCFRIWTQFCRSALAPYINSFRRKLELPAIQDWNAWVNNPACFLACWPAWFSPQSSAWPEHTRHIGFLRSDIAETGEIPELLQQLLRVEPSPILITAGTSVSSSTKRFYSAASAACRIANRSAILVSRHEELLPHPLPPGIQHFKELPFASVMPHAAAVIHHGGAGTMVRAAASGVPQLVLTHGADRPENAARIETLGFGANIHSADWNPSRIARELDRVIGSASIHRALSEVRDRISSPEDLANACAMVEDLANGKTF
jgi:rhamnosyltransferase subunit B